MAKKIINKEEFKQIEAMFSNFTNRLDGLIEKLDGTLDDVKSIKGDLKGNVKGLRSDMRAMMDVFDNGFKETNKGISEVQKNLDKATLDKEAKKEGTILN